MNNRQTLASLIGGFAVYVACAASSETLKEQSRTDASYVETGSETHADSFLQDIAQIIDAVLPDVTVQDVKADDAGGPQPIVVTGSCDKSYPYANTTFYHSELLFPGKTQAELSKHVRVVVCYTATASVGAPPGYQCFGGGTFYFKDGVVSVPCSANPSQIASITATYD